MVVDDGAGEQRGRRRGGERLGGAAQAQDRIDKAKRRAMTTAMTRARATRRFPFPLTSKILLLTTERLLRARTTRQLVLLHACTQ